MMKNVLTVRPGSKPLSFVVSSSTEQAQHLKFISRLLTVEERLYHLVHLTFTIKLISSELYRKRRSTKSRLDYQPLFGKVARAPTPNLLLLIWTNRSSACLPAVANKLCDMKSDRFSGTSNQIPSTNEVMPDLNHSGVYNTRNSQQTLCVRSYIPGEVLPYKGLMETCGQPGYVFRDFCLKQGIEFAFKLLKPPIYAGYGKRTPDTIERRKSSVPEI